MDRDSRKTILSIVFVLHLARKRKDKAMETDITQGFLTYFQGEYECFGYERRDGVVLDWPIATNTYEARYRAGYMHPTFPVPAKIVRVIWGHDDDGVCRHALTVGHNNEGFSFYLGNSTASIEDDWYD